MGGEAIVRKPQRTREDRLTRLAIKRHRDTGQTFVATRESRVQMRQVNLLDMTLETFGRFDVILFAGVLYHLRYPFEAMRIVRDSLVDGGRLILETAVFADANRHAYPYCPTGDENP